jgi:hypothetical protein
LDGKVVGDPSVGGVVDSVESRPESTLRDEGFLTCLRESLYAIRFAAPPDGEEEVTFTVPMEFAPEPDAGS